MRHTNINEATLPATKGVIYHLSVTAKDVANNIIVVGDPERVPKIAELVFDSSKDIFRKDHRGLCVMTGFTKDDHMRLSVITHGMGTGSAEIVLNEILALKAIDINTRKPVPVTEPLNIIRIGTSGALQETTELGTSIITKYSIGLDNTGLFYDLPAQNEEVGKLETIVDGLFNKAVSNSCRHKGNIHAYVSIPHPQMVEAIKHAAEKRNLKHKLGITTTVPGFFNCQGRLLFEELPETVESIDKLLDFEFNGIHPENLEMEVSILSLISSGLKWVRFGAVCMAIANRRLNTFATDVASNLDPTVLTAVDALREMSKIPL
ncbi:Purine nucleoside phosphorylase [Entamoeba marina]